jgi:hypothetical protein
MSIRDRESFEAWLRDKHKSWAQVLAMRAALRILPFAVRHQDLTSRDGGLSFAAFRASFISWAFCMWSVPKSNVFAALNVAILEAASKRLHTLTAEDLADWAAVASSKAAAAAIATNLPSAHIAAIDASNLATILSESIWQAIQIDALSLEAGKRPLELCSTILWPSAVPRDIQVTTERMRSYFLKWEEAWEPWLSWYEGRLEGTPPDVARYLPRALVPDAVWREGPASVNVYVGKARADYVLGKRRRETKAPLERPRTEKKSTVETKTPPLPEVALGEDSKDLLPDAPSSAFDFLDRAPLAFVLAGRINQIHDSQKKLVQDEDGEAPASFVVHIDAPWGGGKTSFAGYLTTILNHVSHGSDGPQWLKEQPLNDDQKWPRDYRRPWFIVHFDAWRNQHNDPPWWSFYDNMRQQILQQIKEPIRGHVLGPLFVPWHRGKAWARELLWRLSAPDFTKNFWMMAALVMAVVAMWWAGFAGFNDKGELELGAGKTGVVALIVTVLLGGAQAIRTVIAAFTSSLLPGTPDAAKNYSLGSGDPLNRFRKHFARVTRRCKRPILVVVDDLDRCEPKFVVELVRGMQTILKSERVIYLLLGDRDWITQSFSVVHKDMEGIEVGAEHEFGERFMEKAIQFSFVLPAISPDERRAYTRRILGQEKQTTITVLETDDDLSQEFKSLSQITDSASREQAAVGLRAKVSERGLLSQAVERKLNLELAQSSAADKTAERATRNRLEGMAHTLPANPRQIKRIINTITYLQEVARLEVNWQPGSPEWQLLARWIVLMIEWPRSWFTLSRSPHLLDEVYKPKTKNALARQIRDSADVIALLDFKPGEPAYGWKKKRITAADARKLVEILPATSGEALKVAGGTSA